MTASKTLKAHDHFMRVKKKLHRNLSRNAAARGWLRLLVKKTPNRLHAFDLGAAPSHNVGYAPVTGVERNSCRFGFFHNALSPKLNVENPFPQITMLCSRVTRPARIMLQSRVAKSCSTLQLGGRGGAAEKKRTGTNFVHTLYGIFQLKIAPPLER